MRNKTVLAAVVAVLCAATWIAYAAAAGGRPSAETIHACKLEREEAGLLPRLRARKCLHARSFAASARPNRTVLVPELGTACGRKRARMAVTADRLLTAAEVAELLAVPARWVREHTRGGLIPHLRLGRYVRYRREDVLAWLDECEHGGAAWRKHRPQGARKA